VFKQVDTVFPDGGFRRTVIKASCKDMTCGEAPWCLDVCGSERGTPRSKERPQISDEEKLALSVRRSQSHVRDITRSSSLHYLLTLTAGKELTSRVEALDAYSGYLHDKKYGRWFADLLDHAYVNVAEPFHDGDGWHIHSAIPGRLPKPALMRLKVSWTAYLHERVGIPKPPTQSGLWRIEIKPPPARATARSLGRYLAKYVGKHFGDAYCGERRYRAGSGCKRPYHSSTLVTRSNADMWRSLAILGHVLEVNGSDGRLLGWTVESKAPPDGWEEVNPNDYPKQGDFQPAAEAPRQGLGQGERESRAEVPARLGFSQPHLPF